MDKSIDTDYKIGKSDGQNWSGIHGYKPESPVQMSDAGMMLAVMSIGSDIEFDLSNIGALLFDELQERYYSLQDASPMNRLEVALNSMRKRLEEILHREPELANTGINLEVAVVTISQDVLFAGVVGESHIYISREGELHAINEALIDPDLNGYMVTGSLELESDDRVLLATDKLAQNNSEQRMVDQLEVFEADKLAPNGGAALMAGYDLDWATIGATRKVIEEEAESGAQQKVVAVAEDEMGEEQGEQEKQESPSLDPVISLDNQEPEATADLGAQDQELPVDSLAETPPTKKNDQPQKRFSNKLQVDESNNVSGSSENNIVSDMKKRIKPVFNKFRSNINNATPALKGAVTKIKSKTSELNQQGQFTDNAASFIRELPARLARILRKVKEVTTDFVRGGKPGENRVITGGKLANNNRVKYLGAAAVVFIGLIVLGIVQYNQQQAREQQIAEISSSATQLQQRLSDLQSQADSTNPSQRSGVIANLEQLETDIQALRQEDLITDEVAAQLDQVETAIVPTADRALRANSFTQPQIVADLATEYQDAQATNLAYAGGQIFVTDEQRNVLYSMGANQNANVSEVARELEQPYIVETDPDGDLVILDRNPDSVLSVFDVESGDLVRQVGLSPSSQGSPTAIDIWDVNSSLYALNSQRESVTRQAEIAGSYQLPNVWKDDAAFANGVDLVVDASIYVLIEGTGLQRYFTGEPAPLEITGLMAQDQNALSQASALTVTPSRFLVADPVGQRVISFLKNPEAEDGAGLVYEGQYLYRGEGDIFTQISDIVVDENNSSIYVLDGNRVIQLAIQPF